jgi:hypothetical protein
MSKYHGSCQVFWYDFRVADPPATTLTWRLMAEKPCVDFYLRVHNSQTARRMLLKKITEVGNKVVYILIFFNPL